MIDDARVEPKLNWNGKLTEGTSKPVSEPVCPAGGGSIRLGQDSKFAPDLSSARTNSGFRISEIFLRWSNCGDEK